MTGDASIRGAANEGTPGSPPFAADTRDIEAVQVADSASGRELAPESSAAAGARAVSWLRGHRRAVVIGASTVLVFILAGSVWGLVESRKLVVPDLIGLPLTDVRAAIGDLDLEAKAQGDLPSGDLRGYTTITSQDPPAGARVFPGRVVLYNFELVDVEVPEIVGLSLGDALEELGAASLSGEALSAQVPIVDEGTGGGGVPGTTAPDAIEAAVRSLGVTGAIDVTGVPFPLRGDADEDWIVVGVRPAAGASIEAGSSVDLVVSLPLSVLPDVVGKTFADASDALRAVGATAVVADTPYFSGTVPEGFPFDPAELAYSAWGGTESELLEEKLGTHRDWPVHAQSMSAGEVIVAGQGVELVVEWPSTTVPSVIGLRLDDVRATLNAAGLASHGIYGSGIARSQSFAPGTVLPVGAEVGAELNHEITFRVTSTASRGTVTWAAPGSFSIEQAGGTSLPWSQTWYKAAEIGRYDRGNFNAQMNGSGSITCEIIINGEVVESRTSTGAYAMVACG